MKKLKEMKALFAGGVQIQARVGTGNVRRLWLVNDVPGSVVVKQELQDPANIAKGVETNYVNLHNAIAYSLEYEKVIVVTDGYGTEVGS